MERGQRNTRKLSKAIQTRIVELVDTMPFNDSEIPDTLIQEGCITEDECKEIREKSNRKDQVRKLVLLIKGRNFEIMKKYMETLTSHCPRTAELIWTEYNTLLDKSAGPWKCPLCDLKECVDIKYVMDTLFGEGIIETGLYSLICHSTQPVGQQDYLWDSVIKACVGANLKHLVEALKAKGHYNHIADSLSAYHREISREVSCLCSSLGPLPLTRKPDSDEKESSTSYSPKSTPFTSTVEDENTLPKSLRRGKENAFDVSSMSNSLYAQSTVTVIEQSRRKGGIASSNASNDMLISTMEQDIDSAHTPLLYTFFCLMCCRKKRIETSKYNAIN